MWTRCTKHARALAFDDMALKGGVRVRTPVPARAVASALWRIELDECRCQPVSAEMNGTNLTRMAVAKIGVIHREFRLNRVDRMGSPVSGGAMMDREPRML